MSKNKTKKGLPGKNTPRIKAKKKKLPFVIIAVIILLAGGFFFYDYMNTGNSPEKSLVKQAKALSDPSILRGGEDRKTLSPAMFTGNTARAYKIAEDYPVLLDSMYCYCNCKETLGHKSLLSCYADGRRFVWYMPGPGFLCTCSISEQPGHYCSQKCG